MRWRGAAWFRARRRERVWNTRSNSHSLCERPSRCITETDHDRDHDRGRVRLGRMNLFRFRVSGRGVEPENQNSFVSPYHRRKRRKGETRVKGQRCRSRTESISEPLRLCRGDVDAGKLKIGISTGFQGNLYAVRAAQFITHSAR